MYSVGLAEGNWLESGNMVLLKIARTEPPSSATVYTENALILEINDMKKNSRLVYSTDQGRISSSDSDDVKAAPSGDGIVRVSRETKGRNGKGVTIVSGLDMPSKELKDFSKRLKQLCGTGGTVKENVVEIQGDQRDKILAFLEKEGFTAKKSGG